MESVLKKISDEISLVKFIGYNINTENEKFFQTNPLFGGRAEMQDLEILFSGLLTLIFPHKADHFYSIYIIY